MIPKQGRTADDVLAELATKSAGDADWRGGRVFSLVYHAGDEHEQLLRRAHAMYASANLLNPMAFGSLRSMEREIVESTVALFSGPRAAVGTVTSGGTESILCAVAAYRDRAKRKKPWLMRPELLAASTIHPAFDKAAHYFGVKLVKVDVGPDFRANARAIEKKISRRTIAIVGSAPQYAHGVVDPIEELGRIAQKHGVPLHVDACVGGFILPWLEKLGRAVPRWDFRVPGVTSISADLHKFGYAGKGASVLLWRTLEDMRNQIFVATDFPGGIYASPTMLGTRPGGPIAAAWAALHALGETGYLALSKQAADAADRLRVGITAIPGLALQGRSDSTIVAYEAHGVSIYAIADRLEARGWTVDRQQRPSSIHLTVTANHAAIVDDYLADLRAAVDEVRGDPKLASSGTAPMYGMAAKMPVRGLVARNVRNMIAKMYAPESAP
ncbi:MAG: Pyridoxal-dependent decarboxylase [Myxococcales bacterium]|nr:Pyridoxal-dependent decarboxylase [Myxococcales bacterium]